VVAYVKVILFPGVFAMKEHSVGEHPEVIIYIAGAITVFDPDNISFFHAGNIVLV
jgi:hypothetical protein